MRKLKLDEEERKLFLAAVYTRLKNHRSGNIENLTIHDITKELAKIKDIPPAPTIKITADTYVKMLELIRQSPIEISWHGMVERVKEKNTYIVYDIMVFPQINSATTTTADEEGFAKWQTALLMDMDFPIENLRLHGHSHVNMEVFSSGVDDAYQEDLLHKVEDGDYYLFLIMNKKMEICPLLYDFDKNVLFEKEDINLEIIDKNGKDIIKWAAYEITEKCEEIKPVVKKTNNNVSYGYWDDEDDYWSNFKRNSIVGNKKKKAINGGRKHGSK